MAVTASDRKRAKEQLIAQGIAKPTGTQIYERAKANESGLTVGAMPTGTPRTLTVGGIGATPAVPTIAREEGLKDITQADYQRRQAFNEVTMMEQRGQITPEQGRMMREEVDRKYPPSGQPVYYAGVSGERPLPQETPVTPTTPQPGQFNTGNAEMDRWYNDVWMPLIEAELTGNPDAIYDTNAFKQLVEKVRTEWEPTYQYEFGEAEKTYLRGREEMEAEKSDFERGLQLRRTRLAEDVGVKQQRIARNYQEAMKDSTDAMAARNLTFGGTRRKAERQLGEQKLEQETELKQQETRTLEDLAREEEMKTGQFGRQLGEMEQGWGRQQKELGEMIPIETERAQQAERERIKGLGFSMYQYPELESVLRTSQSTSPSTQPKPGQTPLTQQSITNRYIPPNRPLSSFSGTPTRNRPISLWTPEELAEKKKNWTPLDLSNKYITS